MAEMKKETSSVNPPRKGRPRVEVDIAMLLSMRDDDNLGWSRMAEAYIKYPASLSAELQSSEGIKKPKLDKQIGRQSIY